MTGDGSMTGSDATMTDGAQPDANLSAHLVVYVSGSGGQNKIGWYDFDRTTGALTPVSSITAFAAGPSFLASNGTHLYAVSESTSRVGAYAVDQTTGALTFINDVATGGNGPAHVSVDRTKQTVLVANYGGGTVSTYKLRADGGLLAAADTENAGMNAHQIVVDPTNAFALVPCLGTNTIRSYALAPATGVLTSVANPATVPTGSGPRHLAFAPGGLRAYVVNELASTLSAFTFSPTTGALVAIGAPVSTRANGATGNNTGAEIEVHPNGKFVYVSNRGDNTIGVFRIEATGSATLIASTPTGGTVPRSFAIDPSGAWLLAANQSSNSVTRFAIDASSGLLTATGTPTTFTTPQFVGFVALP